MLGHLVEVHGDTATLLSVGARAKHLFGKDASEPPQPRRSKKTNSRWSLNMKSKSWKRGIETGARICRLSLALPSSTDFTSR